MRQIPAYLRLLAILALLIRAAVPSGWMPVADAGGIRIAICSGSGPMDMVVGQDGTLHRDAPVQDRQAPRDVCPFGLVSGIAADVPPSVFLAPSPLQQPEQHARTLAFTEKLFPRALRPPPTGPPATV
jgi:hypothetical protein